MSKFPPRQPPDTRLSDLLRKMGLDPNNVQVITASEFDRTDNVIPFPKSGNPRQGVPVNSWPPPGRTDGSTFGNRGGNPNTVIAKCTTVGPAGRWPAVDRHALSGV